MLGLIYEESPYAFLALTVILGGAAAFQIGRAIAQTWQSVIQLIPYIFLLTAAIRFVYYAVLDQTLLSLQFYIVDFITLLIFSVIGWRLKRAGQMTTQYRWMFEPAGPFGWRPKS